MTQASLRCATLVLVAAAMTACRGQSSEEPPIVPIRNMYDQPRYENQGRSQFFGDGRMMRQLVQGTVAREMEIDPEVGTGWRADDQGWVLEVPARIVTRAAGRQNMVTRGQERFAIYCSACHGLAGHGDGLVARRAEELTAAALKPPTLHDDRIRHMPDGQLFATISNGIRNMPSYKQSIPVEDRWAIVTYVRALQLSQARVAAAEPQAPSTTPPNAGEGGQ